MARFVIKSSDIEKIKLQLDTSLKKFDEDIAACKARINEFIQIDSSEFSGGSAESIRARLKNVHLPMLESAEQISNAFKIEFALYLEKYAAIESAADFCLSDSEMEEFKEDLGKEPAQLENLCAEANNIMMSVSDLVPYQNVSADSMIGAIESVKTGITGLQDDIISAEKETCTRLDALKNYIETFKKSTANINTPAWRNPGNYTDYVIRNVTGEEYEAKLIFKGSIKPLKQNDDIRNKLKDKKLTNIDRDKYYKRNGKLIDDKEAPNFYKREMTLAEFGIENKASVNIYKNQFDYGRWGKLGVTVGEAEVHASITGGLYRLDSDGDKIFSPGVKAEIGASVTALELDYDWQALGDEMLGVNVDATVTVGKASATADLTAQVYDENGKLDVQFGGSARAEAIAAEVEGSLGVNVLGGEIGVTGKLNVGVGAHAEVGYRDGVFKFDIGASLGVGFSFGAEIDIGGIVDTISEKSEAIWDDACKFWDSLWGNG